MANPAEQMSTSDIVSFLSATLTALVAADLSLATRTPDAFVAATKGERLKTLPRPAGGTTHVVAVGALRWAMRCDANGIMDSAQVGLYFEDSGRTASDAQKALAACRTRFRACKKETERILGKAKTTRRRVTSIETAIWEPGPRLELRVSQEGKDMPFSLDLHVKRAASDLSTLKTKNAPPRASDRSRS